MSFDSLSTSFCFFSEDLHSALPWDTKETLRVDLLQSYIFLAFSVNWAMSIFLCRSYILFWTDFDFCNVALTLTTFCIDGRRRQFFGSRTNGVARSAAVKWADVAVNAACVVETTAVACHAASSCVQSRWQSFALKTGVTSCKPFIPNTLTAPHTVTLYGVT